MTTSDPASLRLSKLVQKRSRETRRRLVLAANRLWRSRGFDETTVSEVCQAAGVSKGAFYFYFRGKEDLLLELSLATSERSWEDWERLAETDHTTEDVLREIIVSFAGRMERTPRRILARTMLELLGSIQRLREVRGTRKDFASVFGAVFARGQQRKEITSKLEVRELARMQGMLTLRATLAWAEDGREPLADIVWRWTETLLHGSAVPPQLRS